MILNDDGIENEDPVLKYTTYSSYAEMKAADRGEDIPFDDPPPNGCWNCREYNGDFCMKYWNNADECYKDVYRDAKEPNDYCEDHEIDRDAVWEDYFEEELF